MQEQIDLKTQSLTELKALAYDFILATEIAQKNLSAVNQEITVRMNAPDPGLTTITDHKQ